MLFVWTHEIYWHLDIDLRTYTFSYLTINLLVAIVVFVDVVGVIVVMVIFVVVVVGVIVVTVVVIEVVNVAVFAVNVLVVGGIVAAVVIVVVIVLSSPSLPRAILRQPFWSKRARLIDRPHAHNSTTPRNSIFSCKPPR